MRLETVVRWHTAAPLASATTSHTAGLGWASRAAHSQPQRAARSAGRVAGTGPGRPARPV